MLDPVQAAFNIGALIRWVDYNDAFYGATVIHPSDTLSGILATADWLSRTRVADGKPPLMMRDVLEATVKAYEIMGCLALENGYGPVGLDHTILVKIGVTAVVTKMVGGTREEIMNAVSNAWVDGHPLAAFRRKPNTGSRKSWAAGDAASRSVRLALMAVKGEMGYPSALTAKGWGFYDVLFKGKPFKFQRPYGSYVIENVLFKIAYPTAFHGQTGVEAAIKLHPLVKDRLDDIKRIESKVFEREYHDPAKRTNANSIQIFFEDGTKSPLSQVDYPLGHRKRRKEGIPLLIEKLDKNIARVYAEKQRRALRAVCLDRARLAALPVNEFLEMLAT